MRDYKEELIDFWIYEAEMEMEKVAAEEEYNRSIKEEKEIL